MSLSCVNRLSVHPPDRPARYYLDGRRVTRDAYDAALARATRLDCFHTVIDRKGVIRHYSVAVTDLTIGPASHPGTRNRTPEPVSAAP